MWARAETWNIPPVAGSWFKQTADWRLITEPAHRTSEPQPGIRYEFFENLDNNLHTLFTTIIHYVVWKQVQAPDMYVVVLLVETLINNKHYWAMGPILF